jgi:trimeric autotransporter adhesin
MKTFRGVQLLLVSLTIIVLSSCQKENTTNNGYAPALGHTYPGGPVGLGLSRDATCLTVYNGNLIAGGYFAGTTNTSYNYVAQWNGTKWSNLGSGLNGAPNSMIVYNGNLIVAGSFTQAGGNVTNNIAMWNGSSWQPMGTGFNKSVTSLVVFNGNLIAGGSFGGIGNYIAQWNGSSWQAIGSNSCSVPITALAIYNGNLIAAGSSFIAQFNGTSWNTLGSISSINCLATYNGNLYAGGTFIYDSIYYLAKWNGSIWSKVGTEKLGTGFYGGPFVNTLSIYNGNLVVGGQFFSLGSAYASGLAQWNDTAWSTPFGVGIEYDPPNVPSGPSNIQSIDTYSGKLIISGWFTQVGSIGTNYIAQYDSSKWSAL